MCFLYSVVSFSFSIASRLSTVLKRGVCECAEKLSISAKTLEDVESAEPTEGCGDVLCDEKSPHTLSLNRDELLCQ